MRVPGSVLNVSGSQDNRWAVALGVIETGEGTVSVEGVLLSRDVHGPAATGRIEVGILSQSDPAFLGEATARADVQSALALVRREREADPRFAALFERYGWVARYLYDYGMGAVLIGEVADDGTLRWEPPAEGS